MEWNYSVLIDVTVTYVCVGLWLNFIPRAHSLVQRGVEIKVCGACINARGLDVEDLVERARLTYRLNSFMLYPILIYVV